MFLGNLGEWEDAEIGEQCKGFVEKRIKFLENGTLHGDGGTNFKKPRAKPEAKSSNGDYEAKTVLSWETSRGLVKRLSSNHLEMLTLIFLPIEKGSKIKIWFVIFFVNSWPNLNKCVTGM